ncbi:hypothetical protein [Aquimarina sp. 2201CG5-10]|uniref:hypothetical protein n=1 Tax=Aquimarina callyspongiae TaxID=3098150 RepID=UPI002AB51252|nr:hypothetical protein [Aquimarina sp. 2201CG5-10]MDY8137413.1 hypothetical protein [Aquimarina sp. 2201CG5-10]
MSILPELEEYSYNEELEKLLKTVFPRRHMTYVLEFNMNKDLCEIDFTYGISKNEDYDFIINHTEESFKDPYYIHQFLNYGRLNTNIIGVWLESDNLSNGNYSEPSLFFSFSEYCEDFEFILKSIKILSLNKKINCNERLLKQCYHALSKGQFIEHLGVMVSRKEKLIRWYIRGFNSISVFEYLEKVNWRGDLEFLRKRLTTLIELSTSISLVIEFNKELRLNLGIEFHFEHINNCDTFLTTLTKFDYLENYKLPIISSMIQPKRLSYSGIHFKRELSHFKISFDELNNPTSKVYLRMVPDYLKIMGL